MYVFVILLFILLCFKVPIINSLAISVLCSLISNFIWEYIKPFLFTQKSDYHVILINNNLQNLLPENKQEKSNNDDTVKSKIAKRLNYALELINQGIRNNNITIRKMAFTLGLDKEEELDSYFRGEIEPDFEFLNRFAERFGINKEWLNFGEGQPFKSEGKSELLPTDNYERIVKLNPIKIFFVKNKSEQGEAGIILKLDDFKFYIFPKLYNISSFVGTTGQAQIESFYNLIKSLNKSKFSGSCCGRELDSTKFNALFNGRLYPGILDLHNDKELSYWWDDFTDIFHEYSIAKNYEEHYGKEFIKAQEIVKSFLQTA